MGTGPFAHVDTWVFDLDNTLYPPEARLFDQIQAKMTAWVARTLGLSQAEADRLRHDYWSRYGTTLAGLMAEHGVEPGPYLAEVHDISFAPLRPDPELRAAIAALPGRKIVYTNADAPYAGKVLAARGLSELFDGVFGIEHAGYHPKPRRAAYEAVFAAANLAPTRAAMFEDDPRNLREPHAMGLATVHVAPVPAPAPHIHLHTRDLTACLVGLIG